MRIMRPRRSLRMILHGEKRQRFVPQSLQRVVVQIYMRQLNLVGIDRLRIDSEVVVVRRDLHLAVGHILNRMISAVMAELQLVGLATERKASKLMPQTYPKNRRPAHHLLD